MYELFTDCARKVMQKAHQAAHRFNHPCIETEDILLGLTEVDHGVAGHVYREFGANSYGIRLLLEGLMVIGPDIVTMGKLPQSLGTKKVIEYAIEEARNLGHNWVGDEHLLLGLLKEGNGTAFKVLTSVGMTLEKTREKVVEVLTPTNALSPNDVRRMRGLPPFVGPLVNDNDPLPINAKNTCYISETYGNGEPRELIKIEYGRDETEYHAHYGPGVSIVLDGNAVARAIDAYLVSLGVHVEGPRTITVNGKLIDRGHVYVDPSGYVITPEGYKMSGRGPGK